ncbi:hypothetical protein WA158_001762 [Blastocystis sp. Blastoise]
MVQILCLCDDTKQYNRYIYYKAPTMSQKSLALASIIFETEKSRQFKKPILYGFTKSSLSSVVDIPILIFHSQIDIHSSQVICDSLRLLNISDSIKQVNYIDFSGLKLSIEQKYEIEDYIGIYSFPNLKGLLWNEDLLYNSKKLKQYIFKQQDYNRGNSQYLNHYTVTEYQYTYEENVKRLRNTNKGETILVASLVENLKDTCQMKSIFEYLHMYSQGKITRIIIHNMPINENDMSYILGYISNHGYHSLREISLCNSCLSDSSCQLFRTYIYNGECPKLEIIDFQNNTITDKEFIYIYKCIDDLMIPKLKYLNLHENCICYNSYADNNYNNSTSTSLPIYKQYMNILTTPFPKLTYFSIANNPICIYSESLFAFLTGTCKQNIFNSFILDDCILSSSQFPKIYDTLSSRPFQNISVLSLKNIPLGNEFCHYLYSSSLTNLSLLNLQNTNMTIDGCLYIYKCIYTGHLQSLVSLNISKNIFDLNSCHVDLYNTIFKDVEIAENTPLVSLNYFNISDINITGDGIQKVSLFWRHKMIIQSTSIDISNNNLGDSGLSALIGLYTHSSPFYTQSLNISNCQLSLKGIIPLLQLFNNHAQNLLCFDLSNLCLQEDILPDLLSLFKNSKKTLHSIVISLISQETLKSIQKQLSGKLYILQDSFSLYFYEN